MPGGESTTIAKLAHAGWWILCRNARGTACPSSARVPDDRDGGARARWGAAAFADGRRRPSQRLQPTGGFVRSRRGRRRDHPVRGVFIRAPWIEDVGSDVNVLSSYEDRPVVLRQGSLLAASFHPELVGETALHEYFLSLPKVGAMSVIRNGRRSSGRRPRTTRSARTSSRSSSARSRSRHNGAAATSRRT